MRKLTSMPANHFDLKGRGLVRTGAFADVIVLDYDALADMFALDEPVAYARGVEHVRINGVSGLIDGERTGAKPGRLRLR